MKELKNKPKKEYKTRFRNSITVVMMLQNNKKINFKISRNGVFQMTGCQSEKQAEDVVYYLWHYIAWNPKLYEFKTEASSLQSKESSLQSPLQPPLQSSQSNKLIAIFNPVMRNINFNLGFLVNTEQLDEFINKKTTHRSEFEPNIGHTGVNVKFRVNTKPSTLAIVEYETPRWVNAIKKKLKSEALYIRRSVRELETIQPEHYKYFVPYERYLDLLSPKDRRKTLKKQEKKEFSFIVFHSGITMMSAASIDQSKTYYYEFIKLINSGRNEIEECLDK